MKPSKPTHLHRAGDARLAGLAGRPHVKERPAVSQELAHVSARKVADLPRAGNHTLVLQAYSWGLSRD
jgi:hypothetical protein